MLKPILGSLGVRFGFGPMATFVLLVQCFSVRKKEIVGIDSVVFGSPGKAPDLKRGYLEFTIAGGLDL